jgi:hypothetical protein
VGVVDFAPFATGVLEATLDDYRPAGGALLAHRIRWVLDGEELAVERVRRACTLDALPARAFAAPASLPRCPEP